MLEEILTNKYKDLVRIPNQVFTIFSDFFGEDKVDMHILSYEDFSIIAKDIKIGNIVSFSKYSEDSPEFICYSNIKANKGIETILNPDILDLFFNKIIERITFEYFKEIFILVYFPKVTISNENDKHMEINKLFARIHIDNEGTMGGQAMKFNRAEYTEDELASLYMHSHVHHIELSQLNLFKGCCTGSGPIRDTILRLTTHYDEDEWLMFCLELSKYVQVESIKGTPYQRFENIGKRNFSYREHKSFTLDKQNYTSINNIPGFSIKPIITGFLEYLFNSNVLSFNFNNDAYNIAMNFVDTNVLISNTFIKYINEKNKEGILFPNLNAMLASGLLVKAIVSSTFIKVLSVSQSVSDSDIEKAERQSACTFKGNRIPITITRSTLENTVDNHSILLNPGLVQHIVKKIIVISNVNYGTKHTDTHPYTGEEITSYRVQGSPKAFFINN